MVDDTDSQDKLIHRYFDDHGYSVVDVTRRRLQVDYFFISDRRDRRATVQRTASWATRVNSQQVHQVDRGIDD